MDDSATVDERCRGLVDEDLEPGTTIRPTLEGETTDSIGFTEWKVPTLPRISLAPEDDVDTEPGSIGTTPDLRILGVIGEGGMGRVYLARQHSLDREVAVKTLVATRSKSRRQSLLAEALVTGSLEHPGIIPVHALGLDDAGQPVLVMKRVEGVDWGELLRNPKHEAWRFVPKAGDPLLAHLEIFMQVCNAVHFANSRGVVHRDIKPSNVMIGHFGEVYLVDWGIAAAIAEESGRLCGSPAYMAPEMVAGARIDERTDVYLLASTLHQVLTGRLRHLGDDVRDVLSEALISEPVVYDELEVPAELAQLCNRATSREPAERPGSALEIREAVADYLRHRGSLALTAPADERLALLAAMLEDCAPGELPKDLAATHRRAAECRFGLLQALREWPENPGAKASLHTCLRLMIDLELRQRNAAGARALLGELDGSDSDLNDRLERLEAELAASSERDRRLHRLEHDLNPAIDARARAGIGSGLLVAALIIGYIDRQRGGVDPRELVLVGAIIFALQLVSIPLFRKHLQTNAFNRRIAAVITVMLAAVLGNRLVSLALDVEATTTMIRDMLLILTSSMIAGVTLNRIFFWAAIPIVIGLGFAIRDPSQVHSTFNTALIIAMLIPAFKWLSMNRRASDGEPRA